MRRHLTALATLALAAASLAQPAEPTLDQRLQWLTDRLEAARVEQNVPGMALAVVKDDRVVLARGFGLRNVEKGLPADEHTRFAIGSATKSFTATLIGMLVDEGLLSFDDPVVRHLPDFALADAERTQRITIRDLLSHRGGYMRLTLLWYANRIPRNEVIRRVRHAEPVAPLGQGFIYNNVLFMTAGVVAEAVAGGTWEELVRERILDPLGMHESDTDVHDMQAADNHALGYAWNEERGEFEHLPMRDLPCVAPAGAINASASDVARWIRFLLAEGSVDGKRLIRPATLNDTWAQQVGITPTLGYGMGWFIRSWEGKRVLEHGGNIDGFAAIVAIMPDEGVGFVLLQNVSGSPLQSQSLELVWRALLGDIEEPKPADAPTEAAPPSDSLDRYTGTFHLDVLRENVTVLLKDGRLCLNIPSQTTFVLAWPNDAGRWVIQGAPGAEIAFNEEGGAIASFTLYQGGRTILAPRVEPEVPAITAAELDELRAQAKTAPLPESYRLAGPLRYVNQGITGTAEVLVSGERFRVTLDMGDLGDVQAGFDGTSAWARSAFDRSTRILEGADAERIRLSHPALPCVPWASLFRSVEVTGEQDDAGRKQLVVRLSPAHARPITAHVDAQNGLVWRLFQSEPIPGAGALTIETQLSDYRPLGDGRYPMRATTISPATGRLVVTFETIEIDPPIADDAFAPPPDAR